MKKAITIIAAMLITLASVCAMTWTQTVMLIGYIPETLPQFDLMHNERSGQSIVFSTSDISSQDVTAEFSIVQTNCSNYRGTVCFSVSATQLSNGQDSTIGKSIHAFGQEYDSLCFTKVYDRCEKPQEIASFTVEWLTRDNLPQGLYSAVITLTTTAD